MKTQKHLGLKLDEKLKEHFKEHLKDKFAIVNKEIGMLKKLSNYPPRHSLVTLYKAFIRPHLDYSDIIYDKPNNMNISNKTEKKFYKIFIKYLYNYVLTINQSYQTRSGDKFLHMYSRK